MRAKANVITEISARSRKPTKVDLSMLSSSSRACSPVIARLDHMLGPGDYSDAFASAFIAPINPEIFRRRSIASAV
jgi:hypothetical protein